MSKGLEQCDKCDYFISVEEAYQQGRADTIDECIDTLYEVTPQTIDQKLDMVFVNALKQLKER